jgi:hypothetical protein
MFSLLQGVGSDDSIASQNGGAIAGNLGYLMCHTNSSKGSCIFYAGREIVLSAH